MWPNIHVYVGADCFTTPYHFNFWSWLNKELNVSLKNAKKKIQESSIHHHMHHYKASLLACKWYQHQSTLAEYHLHDIVKIWTMGYLELKLTTKTCMHLMEHHQTYLSLSNHHSRFPQSSFSFFFFLLFGQEQHESFSLLFFLVMHENDEHIFFSLFASFNFLLVYCPCFLFYSSINTTCFMTCFAHASYFIFPLTQHVSWHVLPIIPCHGRPLVLKWGEIDMQVHPFDYMHY